MARPKKKGVDYFPHTCISGKTMFIVEQKYGNDGYAFWFKLLEYLGTQEGHFIDCNNGEEMEFLQAKTRLSEDIVCKLLDLLATLSAIDKDLWANRIIWCQNFVDGVADVYLNRRVNKPNKPTPDVVSTGYNPSTIPISTSKSTQSKVKESKVNNSKLKEEGGRIDSDDILNSIDMLKKNEVSEIPLPFESEAFKNKWDEWLQYRKERKLGAYAPTGLKSTFTKLKKISQDDPVIAIEIIDQSLANGWQGLFELKQNFNGAHQRKPSEVGKTIEFDRP